MVIWRFLALARSGNAQTARSELASSGVAGDRAKWPAPIIDFLRGKTDANGLLAAAENADPKTRRGQVCEAEFYLAESYLIDNREREARELLERAKQGCPRDFTEYRGAVVELKRLGG
jgi:lipoprotein NlpI